MATSNFQALDTVQPPMKCETKCHQEQEEIKKLNEWFRFDCLEKLYRFEKFTKEGPLSNYEFLAHHKVQVWPTKLSKLPRSQDKYQIVIYSHGMLKLTVDCTDI